MAIDTPTAPAALPPEEQWPAVALAYEFARSSYEIMLKRYEMVENRIRALATLAASLTFAVPVFANAAKITLDYTSYSLVVALSFAGFILAASALASVGRYVEVPSPELAYAAARDLPVERDAHAGTVTWTYQCTVLQAAGEAWETNKRHLLWKARLGDAIAIALLCEAASMAIWVFVGR